MKHNKKSKVNVMLQVLCIMGFMAVSALPSAAQAISVCRCNQKYFTPQQKLEMSFAVFVGEVESITNEYTPDRVKVGLKIEKSWKGIKNERASVFTDMTDDISMAMNQNISCGFKFEMGQKYLIYSDRSKNAKGPSWVSACGDVIKYENATTDLGYLNGLETLELKDNRGGF